MNNLVIDKLHSEATFQVRHLITKVRGRFTDFEGTIEADETDPSKSSVTFSIRTDSIDTGVPDRDKHLKSEEFFFADKYPTITFASSNVKRLADDQFSVTGTLTIRGVSHEVTLPVAALGTASDPWGNKKTGFEVETSLNRKDYGLNWNAALEAGGFLVGDEVKISLSIQAAVQQ